MKKNTKMTEMEKLIWAAVYARKTHDTVFANEDAVASSAMNASLAIYQMRESSENIIHYLKKHLCGGKDYVKQNREILKLVKEVFNK